MNRLAADSEGAETIEHHAKIGVLGCAGRVGSLIVREIMARSFGAGVSLAGGTTHSRTPTTGDFYTTANPEDLFARADVLIDFTTPEATARHMWLAAKHRKPLVIGTTGLNAAQDSELADAAREAPILYAANMSVGVNLLLALVEQAAARLGPEFDIEIAESHHRHKIDAPSGTALALGRAAQAGRGGGGGAFVHDRKGARKGGDIGFAVMRGGDVVGEHDVGFYGPGERLVLSHRATDRALFARGAIRAALWLRGQKHGLYTMRDALGL